MTDKSTRENRTCLALELARLCPKVPLHEIAADVADAGPADRYHPQSALDRAGYRIER